jgi:hypothetical protein
MNPGVVKRFAEDVDIPVMAMQEHFQSRLATSKRG